MVLVTFRTVQSKIYKIELPPETTIKEAKERFIQESGGGQATGIKMIYKAKLLNDSVTISSLNLGEKDFIVVHVPAAKPAAPPQEAKPQPTPLQPAQPEATPSQSGGEPSVQPLPTSPPVHSNGSLPEIQPLPVNQTPPPSQLPAGGFPGTGIPGAGAIPNIPSPGAGSEVGPSGIPEGPEFQQGVNSLVELGFPRTDCEAALRAAFGNTERAAEYLFSGHIPETEDIQQQQKAEVSMRLIAASLLLNPRALENIVEILERNDPSFRTNPERVLQVFGGLPQERFDLEAVRNRTAQPLDEQQFAQLQAQAMQLLVSQGAPGFAAPGSGPAPGGFAPPGAGPAPGGFAPPGAGPAPGGFAPPGAGPAPGGAPQGAESLLAQFTPEEQEAIRRLQALGNFSLIEVIQIYQACDKNENQAANILFGG